MYLYMRGRPMQHSVSMLKKIAICCRFIIYYLDVSADTQPLSGEVSVEKMFRPQDTHVVPPSILANGERFFENQRQISVVR